MKALTIHQPWASLLVHGVKRFETRVWKTRYRGPLAIHAGKRPPGPDARALVENPTVRERVEEVVGAPLSFPVGRVLGVVELVRVHHADEQRELVPPVELLLGDWGAGRYVWRCVPRDVFEPPPKARGQQGLWNWEGDDGEDHGHGDDRGPG